MREKLAQGMPFAEALAATRRQCIFTTHTPVEAGHDRFRPDLVRYALHELLPQVAPSFPELMSLGRVDPEDDERTVLHDGPGVEGLAGRKRRQPAARAA